MENTLENKTSYNKTYKLLVILLVTSILGISVSAILTMDVLKFVFFTYLPLSFFVIIFLLFKIRKQLSTTLHKFFFILGVIYTGSITLFIVGTIALLLYKNRDADSMIVKSQLNEFSQYLAIYYDVCGKYPTTKEGLIRVTQFDGKCDGSNSKNYNAYKLLDPWKKNFRYVSDGQSFELSTTHQKRMFKVSDKILKAQESEI